MVFEVTILVVGVLGLSLALAYAGWVKVRVIRLREDLFIVRDHLFDRVLALSAADDPAHRSARDRINALIRMAGTISVPTVLYVAAVRVEPEPLQQSDNPEVQKAIDDALGASVQRISSYLARETMSGLLVWLLTRLLPRSLAKREAKDCVARCIDSGVAGRLPPAAAAY